MADITKSIKKTGGDYSTVQAAIDAYATQADTGWYKCEIQDAEAYAENVTINESVSSPSATHYIWLTADASSRHSGAVGAGHARLGQSGTDATVLTVNDDWTRVDWLQIENTSSSGFGNVGVNVSSAADVLVSYCVLSGNGTNAQQAIQVSGAGSSVNLDNCVAHGWTNNGWKSTNSTTGTITGSINHCTFYDCGDGSNGDSAAVYVQQSNALATTTLTVYNTIGCGTPTYADFMDGPSSVDRTTPSGTVTWNGSHNLHTSDLTDIDGTDNTTNWQDASTGGATTTTTTASAVIFSNLTSGSEDLTLVAATGAGSNLAVDNGTNRIGSEPDSRQDFSVDITGATRPTTGVDIGAFVLAGADPLTLEGFRFRADDGNETGATWLEAQDVNVVRLPGINTRLRALIDASGDPASQAYKLQWRLKTTGTWTDVEDG